MLSKVLCSLFLSGLAVASPIVADHNRRGANSTVQLINQFGVIDSDIRQLNNTLNGFEPDSVLDAGRALVIQLQTGKLASAITKATSIIDASQDYPPYDSGLIAKQVLTLEPMIGQLLNNIVVHKPAFSTLLFLFDLSKTVEDDLIEQQGDAAAFGSSLASKLTGGYQLFAPLINSQINEMFTVAIGNYTACTGVVCLPPITL